ncbi:hypothetical protein ACGC1H_005315 [Rhizoctonia solani]|uniref:F-box domain-containing protein n=1 Tax=Rhizoctonia solani TaxID=456999 RepID=A0A8H3C545_9AGAM|nr:unnamed protein product [Rhizoctonia solani]
MQRWEEAGSLLSTALKSYLDSCSNLETACLQNNTRSTDLISRIDSALNSLHTILGQRLAQSRSTLARTRNKQASSLFRFPNEILAEIFLDVIYVPTKDERMAHLEMESTVHTIYRRLHALNNVCSVWRNVAVNCKSAWRVVPLVGTELLGHKRLATDLSLQRGGDRLHLAAIQSHGGDFLRYYKSLDEHAHYFSSANICAESKADLTDILNSFLESKHPLTLSSLSICQTHETRPGEAHTIEVELHVPKPYDYLYYKHSPLQLLFGKLLQSLSTLRISGAFIHWDMTTFSTRLTELHLHRVTLGYNSELLDFLRAASSASELRDLKIISVISMTGGAASPESYPTLSFPKLQCLLLEDLDYNVLQVVLRSIAPGSHRLSLIVEGNSSAFYEEEDIKVFVDFDDLCTLFERSAVDTLLLKAAFSWTLGPIRLGKLLRSMPELKALKLASYTFREDNWDALIRPTPEALIPFPKLEELHLSWAGLFDVDGIKRVVESHSIRKVVIGGYVRDETEMEMEMETDHYSGSELADVRADVVEWLRAVVPEVRVDPAEYIPPEFKQRLWRLW